MLDVLTGKLTFKSLETLDLTTCTKKEIVEYFDNSYDLNESLFTSLTSEDIFYKCPDRLRMPLIFYYGHTASLYVNKLIMADLLKPEERVNLHFETIFETGVNEMSWDDLIDKILYRAFYQQDRSEANPLNSDPFETSRLGEKYSWPTLSEVVEYRKRVRCLMYDVIERTPLSLPINLESKWWAVVMGVEHERIHIETSSVLLRQLPISMVTRPQGWVYGPPSLDKSLESNYVKFEDTKVVLGKKKDHPEYGWDNEYGYMEINVPSFEVSDHLTTNEEFCDFVNDGGYEDERFWSKEGWKWVTFQQAKHPTFWICDQECKTRCGKNLSEFTHCPKLHEKCENGYHREIEKYKFRCMFDVIDMPTNWPVEVNYHEAKAFCKWKSYKMANDKFLCRLLSEAEYRVMRNDASSKNGNRANINLEYGSSTPVNMYPANEFGIYDAYGNVWHLLEDHFNGLPGFDTHFLYHDFSTTDFTGQFSMIAGGSWVSTGIESSPHARFAFRRHFFQHMGFRVVRQSRDNILNLPIKIITNPSLFELDWPFEEAKLNEICLKVDSTNSQFFYENKLKIEPLEVSKFCATKIISLIEKFQINVNKLLLVGCDVGDVIFELFGHFKRAIGVDLLDSNIRHFNKRLEELKHHKQETGDSILFKQLSWLPNEVTFQDLVIYSSGHPISNVKGWCKRLIEIVSKDGLLVVIDKIPSSDNDVEGEHINEIKNCFKKVDETVDSVHHNSMIKISTWRHQI